MDEISDNIFNEELDKLSMAKNSIQRSLYLNEYIMKIQKEQRNSEYALFEPQRELGSQRPQLLEANWCTDQAQRERIHLCSELEMKSRLHQERYARSCQEIEELKRRFYKEENEVTQQKMNEHTMQHDQER